MDKTPETPSHHLVKAARQLFRTDSSGAETTSGRSSVAESDLEALRKFLTCTEKPEEYQVKGKGNKNEYFLLVFVMNFYPDS